MSPDLHRRLSSRHLSWTAQNRIPGLPFNHIVTTLLIPCLCHLRWKKTTAFLQGPQPQIFRTLMNSFSPSPPSTHEQHQSSTFTTSHERMTSNHLHHYHSAPNYTSCLVFHHCLLTILPDSRMVIISSLLHPASRTVLFRFKKHVTPYIRALQCVMSSWRLTRLHLICSSGDLRVLTSHPTFLRSLPLLGRGPPCCCLHGCYTRGSRPHFL